MKGTGLPKGYRFVMGALLLYLALIFPVSAYLPDWVSFENGPVENAQVAVLAAFGVLCAGFFVKTDAPWGRMWLAAGTTFWVLAARELSWGRALFPIGYSEKSGPILVPASEWPYHTDVHIIAGAVTLVCLAVILRYAPWRRIFREISFPWLNLALVIIGMTLSTLGDHGSIYHTMRDQQIEEMGELLLYAALGVTAWYYYIKMKN